jgi:hypothetical protein
MWTLNQRLGPQTRMPLMPPSRYRWAPRILPVQSRQQPRSRRPGALAQPSPALSATACAQQASPARAALRAAAFPGVPAGRRGCLGAAEGGGHGAAREPRPSSHREGRSRCAGPSAVLHTRAVELTGSSGHENRSASSLHELVQPQCCRAHGHGSAWGRGAGGGGLQHGHKASHLACDAGSPRPTEARPAVAIRSSGSGPAGHTARDGFHRRHHPQRPLLHKPHLVLPRPHPAWHRRLLCPHVFRDRVEVVHLLAF